jgi:hypothetical protein
MNTLRINQLPTADAEDLIAILWRALEERRIPSPEINVSRSSVGMDVSVGFGSERDADLVMRMVPHFGSSVGPE